MRSRCCGGWCGETEGVSSSVLVSCGRIGYGGRGGTVAGVPMSAVRRCPGSDGAGIWGG